MTDSEDDYKDRRARDKEIHEIDKSVSLLSLQIQKMEADLKEFITRAEFMPVKMIAYGVATAILSSVMMAILTKVIIK